MLSVQNLGCAGMERLGSPNSSMLASLSSSQRDNRSIRRPIIPVTQHDLIFSTNGEFQLQQHNSGIKFDSYDRHNNNSNVYTSCTASKSCPTHIPRHDGEFGRDKLLSHNQSNAEIKRNYIQAPPNRSIQDVPDASINLQASAYMVKNLSCQKSSMVNKNDKVKGLKGFIKKIIDNSGNNTNSNSISKPGTDYKINNNLFAKSHVVHTSPSSSSSSTSSTSSSSLSIRHILHDESIDSLKSNASSSTNKNLSSEASFQSSSSTSTLLDYNSL